MSDYLGNPALIYDGPDASRLSKPRAPLVLMHDGGGTTFSYHCLDPTNRPLYGIQNVKLNEGGFWEGGISEMASHYIDLLCTVLPAGGDILLGGWSLGGILALEMAYQLATEPNSKRSKFRVLGMVFVDSVFPKKPIDLPPGMENALPKERVIKTPEELKAMKLKEKVALNMIHARVMIQGWKVPQWKGVQVPPTIMLRAKEYVDPTATSFVDHSRQDRLLGWEAYNQQNGNFINAVLDVEGHHFNIFEMQHIENVTMKICRAADMLDEPEF